MSLPQSVSLLDGDDDDGDKHGASINYTDDNAEAQRYPAIQVITQVTESITTSPGFKHKPSDSRAGIFPTSPFYFCRTGKIKRILFHPFVHSFSGIH